VLKGKIKHLIGSIFRTYKMPRDMQVEFDYLKGKIDNNKILEITYKLFTPKVAQKIFETIIENTTVDSKTYFSLNRSIRKDLKNNRRTTSTNGSLLSKYYRGIDLCKKILNRKFNQPNITKKVTSSGGKIITFIGVDGSGKSTVSDVIVKWIGRKIECKKIYMGTGDGKKNVFAASITLLKSASRNRNKKEKIISSIKEIKFTSAPINYIKKYIHALVIYSVVKDNRKKILKMHRYRLNGGISVLDRFPQLEQENINDGLKLSRYAQMLNSKFLTRLAYKESELLSIVDTIYPDLVFRLKISPELSILRKPEEHYNFDAIKFKTESVNMLKFEKSLVYDIDASKDFSIEILDIKKIIWENL
jgi:thymidylate kinase